MTQTLLTEAQGRMRWNFHAGQWRAWQSSARFVLVLAGTQGGKTVFGPPWLYREIQRRGPGDYMVVTPTFPLLGNKALPAFLELFDHTLKLGEFRQAPTKVFTFSADGNRRLFGDEWDGKSQTRVLFGHAADSDSLESATAKAAWLDEAGQPKFRLSSWEAIQRRLSIHQGRALITTTPYDLGWLKSEIYDRWEDAVPGYDVIRFDSTENPTFPREEYDRMQEILPAWKFNMFYRAIYTTPAGLIYDSFDRKRHVTLPFPIPEDWQRYCGIDFGNVNTAAVFFAKDPQGQLYLYREYHGANRTAREHVQAILSSEPGTEDYRLAPFTAGGARSEGQWRDEFAAAGLWIREPLVPDVEVGIQRVYAAHRKDLLHIFSSCERYLTEKMSYSRAIDESGNVLEDISDKHSFHFMDAERYIIPFLYRDEPQVARKRGYAGRKVRGWATR